MAAGGSVSNLKYLLFSGMFLSGIGGYQYSNIPDTFSRGKTSSTFGEVFLNLDKFHFKKFDFFVHNLVHAKCANFCFVGKE